MKQIEKLLSFFDRCTKVICYGAGRYGSEIDAFLKKNDREIDCFAESKPVLNKKNGKSIKKIDDVAELNSDTGYIIGASTPYQKEMLEYLQNRGIEKVFVASEELMSEICYQTTKSNLELYNSQKGKRCFILGMGPSIKKQSLSFLKNEFVFSCSWCSLLEEYQKISPQYFISPAIMCDPIEKEEDREKYGKEFYEFLSKTITSDTIILDYADKSFVEYYDFFSNKKIYYIDQTEKWDECINYCDLSKKTPVIQTASVMMLKIAIYMGFDTIILLGTEHDIVKRTYDHSYDIELLKSKGYPTLYNVMKYNNELVEKNWSVRKVLRTSLNMYDQYHYLHQYAQKIGIKIYNATIGGDLDEFDRVDFNSLF